MKTFAQRFDNAGNLLWDVEGVQIHDQDEKYKMISDGESGAIVVFDDYHDISFIRLNSSGNIFWADDTSKIIHPKDDIEGLRKAQMVQIS